MGVSVLHRKCVVIPSTADASSYSLNREKLFKVLHYDSSIQYASQPLNSVNNLADSL